MGSLAGTAALIAEGLSGPDTDESLADPRRQLRRDRQALMITTAAATLASGLVVGTTCTLVSVLGPYSTGLSDVPAISVAFALVLGPILGMASGAGSAWLRFQQARLRLFLQGRVPWKVVDFLDDAHHRGVLRKVGPEYQFRHVRLQECLARGQR